MTFGYGATICPDCYDGEQPFLFFDDKYWLNRIMMKLLGQWEQNIENKFEDALLGQSTYEPFEIDILASARALPRPGARVRGFRPLSEASGVSNARA